MAGMRRFSVVIGASTLVAASVTSIGSSPPVVAAAAETTFEYTGSAQDYDVPAGVTRVVVEAWGAQGGIYDVSVCDSGGFGGYTRATLAVTPGETLQVFVGGRGSDHSDTDRQAGGFNGGGRGHNDSVGGSRGGGGASDVRRAPFGLDDRLVVAGGGGGAGNLGSSEHGGAGGGLTGADGTPSPNGGSGGTPTDGGAPGTTQGTPFAVATAGAFGQGGDGGANSGAGAWTGGGGGGGWYGGGGGGGRTSGPGAGGGGGSSFGPAGAVLEQGVNGFSGQCDEPAKHGEVRVTPAPSGGTFHALTPERILDTRDGLGALPVKVPGGHSIELQVTGRGGVPSTGVAAVALNLTVDQPEGPGFITGYPCGEPMPTASNGNYAAGQAAGSAAVLKVGAGGRVCIFTLATAHLIADVSGWIASDGTTIGARYTSLPPDRLVDTRQGSILGNDDELRLTVLGQKGVPTTGVTAVTVNLTVTGPTGHGFVMAYPCGQTRPVVSNVNYGPGQTVANLATVKVGTNGQICIYALASTHVIVDIAGWYGPAADSTFTTLSPGRNLDTRVGLGAINQPIPAAGTIAVIAAGRNGVPPTGATAVVLSVAATNTGGPGFLTFYPCNLSPPTASNLNYSAPGQTIANLVVVKLDASGRYCVFSPTRTDAIADVAGYLAG